MLTIAGRPWRLVAPLFLFAITAAHAQSAEPPAADAPVVLQGVTVNANHEEVEPPPQRVDVNATETKDIVTKTKIKELGTTTDFLFTLNDLPNTVVWDNSGNGVSGANIVINGFDRTRINFQLDGIPLSDPDSYSFYSNEFAQNDILKSLVVTPGAGKASVVGLAAIGGNIELNTDDPESSFYVQPRLGTGSYDKDEVAGKVSSGTFLQGIAPTSFYAAGTRITAESFFNNNQSTKNNIAFKSATSLLGGTFTAFFAQNNQLSHFYEGCTQAQIKASGDNCNFYNNTPTSTNDTNYNYNKYLDWLAYGDYKLPLGKAVIDNNYYYYYGNGFSTDGSSVTVGGAKQQVVQESVNLTHRWGDILKATIDLGHGLSLEPGAWFQLNRSEHFEANDGVASGDELSRVYDEFVSTLTATPYVDLTWKPLEHLTLDAGLKYLFLNRTYDAPPPTQNPAEHFSTHFNNFLPSFGANYEFLEGWHGYVNYARNARPPGYSEFYTGNFALNQDLRPETTNTYSGGIYLDKGPFEGRISGYATKYQNYILNFSVPNGSGFVTAVVNGGNATYYGGSVAMTFMIQSWLQAFANLGLTSTKIDKYNGAAPYAPYQTQSAGLFALYQGFSANLSVDHAGARYYIYTDPFNGENPVDYIRLPALTTVNASVGYSWKTGNNWLKQLDANLALRNITDTRVPVDYNIGAADSYDPTNPLLVLNAPFSVFFTLDAKLF